MSVRYDVTTPEGLDEGVQAALSALRDGKVVVLPTDTVYGIGADAFDATAVAAVLAAKGRGREMPPPVLVPDVRTVDGLARDVPTYARALIGAFWPGGLTLVLTAQPSLTWDLGETNGTVALRMPDDQRTLELLSHVGPMAVTSANRTGQPAATTADEAQTQLGDAVAVYLDGGPAAGAVASTILDCTGEMPLTLREGAVPQAEIDAVVERAEAEAEAAAVEAAKRAEQEAAARRRTELATMRTGKGVGHGPKAPKRPAAGTPHSSRVAGRRKGDSPGSN